MVRVEGYLHKNNGDYHIIGGQTPSVFPQSGLGKMPHTTWATEEQEEWLKSCIPEFLNAHPKEMLSIEFFPSIVKEFCDKWLVDLPTAE